MSIENLNVHGTTTRRISCTENHKSNTPKSGNLPSRFQVNEEGHVYYEAGICGLHMGPRTKQSHPWSYDPLLAYSTGQDSTGSCCSDRLLRWRPVAEVRAFMQKHFGDEGDYFDRRTPAAIQAFLRDTLNLPELQLTRIEEHCNANSGYPYWHFSFIRGADSTDSISEQG